MIQELLGGAALIAGERKISINGGGVAALVSPGASLSSSSPSPSSTTTTTTSTTVAAAGSTNSENQNLRCPRCDSSNTKFCYYNNYNLTQPRHFCKTCRRYWTKGGALRNVPIGGSCRKNRNVSASNSFAKTSVAKMKTVSVAASELERSVLGVARFIDHDLPTSSPVLWGPPQNSHLLALLRASQNPNPNPSTPNMSVNGVKEEGSLMGSHTVTEPMVANGLVSGRALGFDTVGQFPALGLCGSIWRNNNCNNNEDGTFLLGEHHQSSGIQELYQRLRSSSVNYCSDNVNSQVFMGNMVASSSSLSSSSSSSLSILESAPVVAGDDQLGYTTWNPTFSWSDPPTTNGTAYP